MTRETPPRPRGLLPPGGGPRAHADPHGPNPLTHDAPRIRVMEACPRHGKACAARWFTCHLQHGAAMLATYECQGDGDGYVTPAEVAYVRELHPGATLIYI